MDIITDMIKAFIKSYEYGNVSSRYNKQDGGRNARGNQAKYEHYRSDRDNKEGCRNRSRNGTGFCTRLYWSRETPVSVLIHKKHQRNITNYEAVDEIIIRILIFTCAQSTLFWEYTEFLTINHILSKMNFMRNCMTK